MDTHISPSPPLDDPETIVSARLPGEPEPDSISEAESAGQPEITPGDGRLAPKVARKRRSGLLSGVAIVAVVVVASGAFVLSPYNHVFPVPREVTTGMHQLAARAGINLDRPFAPSASLASVNLPPRPGKVVAPRYQPQSRDQTLRELLAMRAGSGEPGSAPAQTPALHTPPHSPAAPPAAAQTAPTVQQEAHEPGAPAAVPPPPAAIAPMVAPPAAPAHPPVNDITQAVTEAALAHTAPAAPVAAARPDVNTAGENHPAPTAPAPSNPAPAAAPAAPVEHAAASPEAAHPAAPQASPIAAKTLVPADPINQALHLRAAPMASEDQVKVLELVTQMATIVRDLKSQNAALRQDFAKTAADDKARLADFERRIDLAEARNAVAAAAAGDAPAPASAPVAPLKRAGAAIPITLTRVDAAIPAVGPADAKRYRVQAASPGLALLTEVERGGGDGAQIQVTVGDKIPGWGVVKSIAQKGTGWVVSTEHGVIE